MVSVISMLHSYQSVCRWWERKFISFVPTVIIIGPKISTTVSGHLNNIRKRLRLLFGERYKLSIDDTADCFDVQLLVPVS